MNLIRSKMEQSPVVARVLPFAVFLILTGLQDSFGETGRYWIYFGKTIAGAWLIWMARPFIAEMRWAFSWEALVVGVGVFAMWVGVDPFYPHMGQGGHCWNPLAQFGAASLAGWIFVVVRTLGSTLVVPPLEEVFYRSFVYRYVASSDFKSLPLNHFSWTGLLVTSTLFGLTHYQWLAGILCGLAYQCLTYRKGKLGDAMTAHAITNFLLAIWVIWKGAWQFW